MYYWTIISLIIAAVIGLFAFLITASILASVAKFFFMLSILFIVFSIYKDYQENKKR